MATELLTPRLTLRQWRDADKAAYAALNADPEVMRHFPSTLSAVQSDEMVERMRSRLDQEGWGLWAAERLDTGQFIGFVGLSRPSFDAHFTPAVEIGWRLARAHWGNGFATEAAQVAMRHAFIELGLDEVVSFTTQANARSRRVMVKLGMSHDPADDFDHPLLAHWPGRRHVLYRIDRQSWAAKVAR